jgi:uncharacterized protein (DUF2141 family)
VLLTCASLAAITPTPARAQDPPCEGQPSDVRLFISVDRVARTEGQIAATIYPDDPRRFLAHHGQLAVIRRPSTVPSTSLCMWLPAPGRYEVAVYQDLNGDRRFNRTALGFPAEPYGLSNDPPNLLGLPTFRSVQFPVHVGDNTLHIPLHQARR